MRAGVDLGGTKIDVLIVEGEREVHGRARRPTPTEGGPEAVVAAIVGTIEDAADAASVRVDQLSGIGVGSPGAVDSAAGAVGFNSNLAGGWTDPYPFAEELARRVGTPVRVANDVAVAAAAELEPVHLDDHPETTAAATFRASTCSRTSWTRRIVAPRS